MSLHTDMTIAELNECLDSFGWSEHTASHMAVYATKTGRRYSTSIARGDMPSEDLLQKFCRLMKIAGHLSRYHRCEELLLDGGFRGKDQQNEIHERDAVVQKIEAIAQDGEDWEFILCRTTPSHPSPLHSMAQNKLIELRDKAPAYTR